MASPISSDTPMYHRSVSGESSSREADSQSLEILQIRVSDMLFTFLDIHFSLALSGSMFLLTWSGTLSLTIVDNR